MTEIWQDWEHDLVFGSVPQRGTFAHRYPALAIYRRNPTAPGSHLQLAAAWEATAHDLIQAGDFEVAYEFLCHAKDIMLEGWEAAYDDATTGPRLRLVAGPAARPIIRTLPRSDEPEGRSA